MLLLIIVGCTAQQLGNSPLQNASFPPSENGVIVKFQPKQCESTPWETWYKEGHIKFIRAPTDKQLATAYYSHQGIVLMDYRKVESGMMTCQACGVCPTSYYYTAKVASADAQKLKGLGWG